MRTFRLFKILFICIKYDLGRFLTRTSFPKNPIWIFPYLLVFVLIGLGWALGKKIPKERALRKSLEELGPIFIKFGQILSTRVDLLSKEMVAELSYLQDRVPPSDTNQIKQTITRSLGGDLSIFFSQFDDVPAASASVAQVHFAILKKEREEVAVKVIKPNIQPIIKKDISLLYLLASLINSLFSDAHRLRLEEVIGEFEYTLAQELNMQQEGANACHLKRNFPNSDFLMVPKIYWEYTSKDVLTMERISGININKIDELKKAKVNMRRLAEKGVEIFFTQVFRDSFFHADMHPGNIFIDVKDPENPIYKGVDFGIMGSLSETDKKYLALNFLSFFNRDYRRVAELHIRCGWVQRETRVERLEAAIRGVCEPIFAKSLSEISFGRVLSQLLHTARTFNMEVQPQLLLLQKTLINVEGLGRQLYPQLNVWETAKPHLVGWYKNETSVRHLVKNAKRSYPELLIRGPDLAADALMLLEDTNRFLKRQQLKEENTKLYKAVQRRNRFLWGGGIILLASLGYILLGL